MWIEDEACKDFLSYEADAILRTPIGNLEDKDSQFWIHNTKGKYSVKPGYRVNVQEEWGNTSKGGSSSAEASEKWRNKSWNLSIPPKIRIFWWKMTHDIVVLEENFVNHHVPILPCCRLCDFATASTTHSIFFCPFGFNVWKKEGLWCLMKQGQHLNSWDFLNFIFENGKGTSMENLAVMA
ncbi:hypothetical protein ACS0TY_031266 [Phlomoides rotata]